MADADDSGTPGKNEMDVDKVVWKRKPSQKQRKAAQLRRSNPQREKAPLQLADHMVKQAENVLDSGRYISRGQRKRLTKKSKFVNQKILEKKFKESALALQKLEQERQRAIRLAQKDNTREGDIDMAVDKAGVQQP